MSDYKYLSTNMDLCQLDAKLDSFRRTEENWTPSS